MGLAANLTVVACIPEGEPGGFPLLPPDSAQMEDMLGLAGESGVLAASLAPEAVWDAEVEGIMSCLENY